MRTRLISWAGLLLLGGCVLSMGCAQNTETPSRQENVTPTSTAQDTATLGSTINLNIYNTEEGGRMLGRPTSRPAVDGLRAEAGSIESGNAGYIVLAHVTITTGGTTPNVTGSATGTGTATQNPGVNARQDPRTDLTASIPIAVAMPGGMNDQQATATGREGTTSGTAKTSENELRYAQLNTTAAALGQALEALKAILAEKTAPAPTSQPTSQPAE